MKDEIKEILDNIKTIIDEGHYRATCDIDYEDCKILLDYITNLQEENERLSIELNKNMIERNNYLSRNEKAIEHIEESLYILKGDGDILIATSNVRNIYIKPLLNILKGSDKE